MGNEDVPHVVATHLGRAILTALHGQSSTAAQNDLVRRVLDVLDAPTGVPVLDERGRFQQLLSVTQEATPPRPATPLSEAALLTNSPGEPALGSEIRAELESADSVDLIVAFLKWSGLRLLDEPLRRLRDRGAKVRIITTTYMGATERRTVDALVRDYGADVKVIYETTRTRLHAKAWIFRRNTGFHTGYVGSSNLSRSALLDGLEWNVRLSSVATPALIDKFDATFESYWASPTFETYDPDRDAARLDAALRDAGATGKSGTPVDMSSIEVTPRPHQQEMLEQLAGERQLHGRHRNLVVAATGTGKTVLAALDYRDLRRQHGRDLRLLFVAHRKELLEQAMRTYRQVLADGSFGELLVGGLEPREGRHVFASVQSLTPQRIASLPADAFDVVVLDECHHGTAPTYRRVVEHFEPMELLGLTATPERGDGRDVLALFDGRIATELRLWDALADDLLVPFHYFGVNDEVDLSAVKWSRGRYDVDGLENLYTGNDARARIVLRELERRVSDPQAIKGLGFCVSVAHAQYMARVFTDAGIPSVAVSSESDTQERTSALGRLRRGEIAAIFTVDLYNEGVDVPEVDTALFLRPTESSTVFLQQLGRGLRTAHGKAVLTVLDFVGNQNEGFRFDARFQALTGLARGRLAQQVEKGFPLLPTGCSIVLDRVVQERVLSSLKRQLQPQRRALVNEVRSLGTTALATFLAESGHGLREVLRSDRSWTMLCREAGLDVPDGGDLEPKLLKRVAAVAHVDDSARAETYRRLLRGEQPTGSVEEALARMLTASLVPGSYSEAHLSRLAGAVDEPAVRDELSQVVDLAFDTARRPTAELAGSLHDVPLAVHARYSRNEIVAALGLISDKRPPERFREGVLWAPHLETDAFLITLNKSDADFSPTTMYRDYPLTRELFHWESQSTTSVASVTGQRYLHHRENGTHVLLFARPAKTGDLGPEPFLFLGQADYVSHRGDRPIAITWKLRHEMPMDFFAAATVVQSA
ncbi:superfamily II DNA or RNA helicase/HKD family nuclease [Kineococcus aurantiacus]|uniref:Superfamily II DNA or RNA helicase/HKD family nuclease n=1 Tax=Kineococcus aurantiacus TaxID=37633 RepID=A0A7Y9DLT8_9ACTN|nr:superfamily II DNA or RNA helicase/HKD family nuclease [Kineococcus aurantiacus]